MTLLPGPIDPSAPFPRLSRRLRLGVVGGGRIAATQAAAARMTGRWEVVAGAFSSDPVRSRGRAAEWFVEEGRAYPDFAAMAEAEAGRPDGVDAVMVTTPNDTHAPAATAFLEAGIAVMCDKPMTNAVAEAEALVATAARTGGVLAVGYVMSCFPMVRQARHLVASGALGEVNQIHAEFLQDWMTPPEATDAPHVRWRVDPARSGPTSCTGDIGTHAAHLAGFVTGLPITELRADLHVCGHPKPLEDTALMATRHGAVPGTLMATRQAPGRRGGLRLRAYGSEGGLEWHLEEADRLLVSRWDEPDRLYTRGPGHGIAPQVARLLRAGRGFPEGILEAWGVLYDELAMAVAARRDGSAEPEGWLDLPRAEAGAEGVRFVDAAVRSNAAGGAWTAIDRGSG